MVYWLVRIFIATDEAQPNGQHLVNLKANYVQLRPSPSKQIIEVLYNIDLRERELCFGEL